MDNIKIAETKTLYHIINNCGANETERINGWYSYIGDVIVVGVGDNRHSRIFNKEYHKLE